MAKLANVSIETVRSVVRQNMKLNQYVDTYSRLTYYLFLRNDAKTGGKIMKRLGIDSPMEGVRKVLFDPTDMSYFEDEVMKKDCSFLHFHEEESSIPSTKLGKKGF